MPRTKGQRIMVASRSIPLDPRNSQKAPRGSGSLRTDTRAGAFRPWRVPSRLRAFPICARRTAALYQRRQPVTRRTGRTSPSSGRSILPPPAHRPATRFRSVRRDTHRGTRLESDRHRLLPCPRSNFHHDDQLRGADGGGTSRTRVAAHSGKTGTPQ